jgi:hypothetical protein
MKANSMNASGGLESVGPLLALIVLLGVWLLPSFMARRNACQEDVSPTRQLDSLLRSFGKVAPPVRAGTLELLYAEQNFTGMLGWIKNSLRLELSVGLRIISQPDASAPPMWIEVPKTMPTYGTKEFRSLKVVVNARKDLLDTKPFTWIVAGFAHELCHVVLFSIGHPLQHEEKAVDLTAMILGYREFVVAAEYRFQNMKHSIGYLTSEERSFAYGYLTNYT